MTPRNRAELHALFGQLAAGERAAIGPAFTLLWPVLRDFTARALGGDGQSEDAAQQAAITIFEKVSDFDASRDAVGWALAIASYEVRSLRRRRQRRREEPLDGAGAGEREPASDADPEHDAIERDLVQAARDVLSGLKEEDVVAILTSLGDERPPGDATFRKRLQRAMARLKNAWSAKHGTH